MNVTYLLVLLSIIGLFREASSQDVLLMNITEGSSTDLNSTLESVFNSTNILNSTTEIPDNTENFTIGNETDFLDFDHPLIPTDYILPQAPIRSLRSKKDIKKYNCQFKCIVSDLDGSLSEIGANSISAENAEALRGILNSNVRFFVSTGKSVSSSIKFIESKLGSNTFPVFPGVYYNGALVYGPGGIKDVLFESRIKASSALELIKYLRKFGVQDGKSLRFESNINGVNKYHKITGEEASNEEVSNGFRLLNIAIENTSGVFLDSFEAEHVSKYLSQEVDNLIHRGVNLIRYLEPKKGEKMKTLFKIVVAEAPEVLSELREHIDAFVRMFGCKVHRSAPYLLEIIPANASKYTGSKLILKKLGVKFHQTAFLGDGENDIEIMSKVGFPIATRGSAPAITYIARTVQLASPEVGLVSLVNENCVIPDCNKKKEN